MWMRAPQKTGMSAALALVALLQAAATPAAPPAAQDLAWGETLYYFYQQDYIPAITRLQVARTRQELAYHDQESELVLGGLMLGYGMHRRAEAIFQALLERHPRPSVRDQAWYFLAQARFQRGLSAEALAAQAVAARTYVTRGMLAGRNGDEAVGEDGFQDTVGVGRHAKGSPVVSYRQHDARFHNSEPRYAALASGMVSQVGHFNGNTNCTELV